MGNLTRPITRRPHRSPLEHRRGGGAPFDPASIPMSAFYDRTVLATLFQDSAGTTPGGGSSQPLGLNLDKSQGLELGPELVTNGTFDTNLDGWISDGPTAVWNAGTMEYVSSYGGSVKIPIAAIAGKTYKVSATILESAGNNIRLDVLGAPYFFPVISAEPVTNVVCTWYVQATGTDNFFSLAPYGGSSGKMDNVSVREILGNHAIQPTAGKRSLTTGTPIYADFDLVDDDLVTTFPSSRGTGCVVARSLPSTGASITTGVTIGTTFTDNVDAHALCIYTAAEWAAAPAGYEANLTAWLNAKAGL